MSESVNLNTDLRRRNLRKNLATAMLGLAIGAAALNAPPGTFNFRK